MNSVYSEDYKVASTLKPETHSKVLVYPKDRGKLAMNFKLGNNITFTYVTKSVWLQYEEWAESNLVHMEINSDLEQSPRR